MKASTRPDDAASAERSAAPPPSDSKYPGWLSLLAWFILGLLTTLPGLSARSLHYDEALEGRLAQLPIASQYASYAKPAAREIDSRSGLVLDSPHLYHSMLHPVLSLLGTSAFSIRLLAWLAGGLLVPLAFVLLTSLFPARLAALATLGFNFCAWRVELAQMGRPHSLFLAAAMLSLILFSAAATRRSWAAWLAYCVVLAVAVQTSYWGILVVVPSHLVATVLLRRTFPYWRRAVAAQAIAGATSVYYASTLLMSYGKHSAGDSSVPRALAVPLFGRSLALFGVGSLDKLDLADLPFAVGITLVVFPVVLRGTMAWWRSGRGFSRWLGACVGFWVVLLFAAHFAARSLASWPMERKFALLLVPLLISFVFGVQSIRSRRWRYGVMGAWIVVTAFFGARSMAWDPFRDSARVRMILAAQPRPLLVYSNRELMMEFLVGQTKAAGRVSFQRLYGDGARGFKWTDVRPDVRDTNVCICLLREGYYLRGRLRALTRSEVPPDVDGKMKNAVEHVTERLTASRWRSVASAYYPGRISYQVACFAPGLRR